MPTILIGADICPIEGNQRYFEAGDAANLFHDLLGELQQADLTIANLECPFIEKPSPITKTGPVFGVPNACIKGIKAAGIDVLSLANNHILDHGLPGLTNTIEICAKAELCMVGAGTNVAAAREILVKQIDGVRIGIHAVAEHEFSIATRNSAGANPLDVIDFVRNINRTRSSFEYLIILLHGGDEFFVPTPRLQDTCRFMIEMGANAVIVQHPHVLGGYEDYRGGHIVYGQGALIMDEAVYRDRKSFHEGFLVKLSIAKDASSKMDLIPFTQSDPVPGARRMSADAEKEFRNAIETRSRAILDDDFVAAEWRRFCEDNKHDYLSSLLGHNRLLAKMNSGGLLEKCLHGKRPLLRARNIVSCETHREAIETIFTNGF